MDMMHYEIKGDCLVVYIRDDLDHHAVTYLRETSDRLIEAGNVKNIIFDFKDVSFMDSSGIGMVMGRYKKMGYLGGNVYVTGVGKGIDRIFSMSGLYKIIQKV